MSTPVSLSGGYDPAQLAAQTAAIQEAAGGLALALRGSVQDKLNDINSTVATIQAKIVGTIDMLVGQVLDACRRSQDRIARAVDSKVSDIYAHMSAAGINFPTQEQVDYYVQTRDSLGAMGYAQALSGTPGNDGILPAGPVFIPPGGIVGTIIPPGSGTRPPIPRPEPRPAPSPTNPPTVQPQPVRPIPPSPGSVPTSPPGVPPSPISGPPAPGQPGVPSPIPVQQLPPGVPPGNVPPTTAFPQPGQSAPGQPIPCPFNPATGMWDNCSFPPDGTVPSVGTGDTLPGATCPPGYMPSGSASYLAGSVPVSTGVPAGTHGPRSLLGNVIPCYPPLLPGWMSDYAGIHAGPSPGQHWALPWSAPSTVATPIDTERVCVAACHFIGNSTGGKDVSLTIPAGYRLYFDTATNRLVAADYEPDNAIVVPLDCPPDEAGVNGGGQPPNAAPVPPGCVPVAPGGHCVIPKAPACGPDLNGKLPPLNLRDDQACDDLADLPNKMQDAKLALDEFLGMKWDSKDTGTIGTAIIGAITGSSGPIIPGLINRAVKWMQGKLEESTDGLDCDKGAMIPIQVMRAAFGMFGGWFGLVPEQFLIKLDQMANTVCHIRMPTTKDAAVAWLNDAITDSVYECWVKADGSRVSEAKAIRDGERERANPAEIFRLFRRKLIDEDTRNKLLRGRGVTNDDDRERLWRLTEEFAPIQDLIRFMRRDVYNEDLVKQGKLDEGFDRNYTDKAKDDGYAIGMTDDLARRYWMAHWQIPSFTMLREMLFRLTPDKYPDDMAVTRDVMHKALYADGWAPGYIDRMIEISYLPINRTDFTSMYFTSVIDDDELKTRYMTVGYKAEDADKLVTHMKVRKRLYNLQKAGYPSIKQLVQMYAQCQIDESTLQNGIEKWTTSDEQVQEAMDAAEIKRQVWQLKQSVTTIQRQYRYGLIDDQTAIEQLGEVGMDTQCVPGFVRRMRKGKTQQVKHVPASALCKWRALGLIGEREQLEALVKLGYAGDDALRIVQTCTAQIESDLQKQAAAAAKKEATAAKASAKSAKTQTTSKNP